MDLHLAYRVRQPRVPRRKRLLYCSHEEVLNEIDDEIDAATAVNAYIVENSIEKALSVPTPDAQGAAADARGAAASHARSIRGIAISSAAENEETFSFTAPMDASKVKRRGRPHRTLEQVWERTVSIVCDDADSLYSTHRSAWSCARCGTSPVESACPICFVADAVKRVSWMMVPANKHMVNGVSSHIVERRTEHRDRHVVIGIGCRVQPCFASHVLV